MLLTVLGEFVLPCGGSVWTATVLDALAALGLEEGAARQAMARTSARGLLRRERQGRRTQWSLTERSTRLLVEGTERIYSFGLGCTEWDGEWLLLLVKVPEENRHLRAQLRTRLGWLGFGSLGGGNWVTPWSERELEAKDTLAELGLAGGSLSWRGRPGDLGSLEERVGDIWDLPAVAREYEEFVTNSLAEAPDSPVNAFAALTRLVHDWRHFPATDPGLPAMLLPESWPAVGAAHLFHDKHDEWAPGAWAWWREHSSE
ncbi:MAG: PaaX family transcriptional regulator [Acidimicrobiales bacterium]